MCGGIFHHVDTPGSIIHSANWRLKLKAFHRNSVVRETPQPKSWKRGNQVWDPLHSSPLSAGPRHRHGPGPSSFVLLGHQGPRQPTYPCPLTKPTARPGLRDTRSPALSLSPSRGLSLCPASRRFTPLGLQGPLPSADPGLSLLPRERGFSLPASGMGLPGWQEQGHSLQGLLVLPPREGPPEQATGAPSGCPPGGCTGPWAQRRLSSGGAIRSHSASLPQIQLLSSPAIPSRHLSFLAMFRHKQAQSQLKPTSPWSLPPQ